MSQRTYEVQSDRPLLVGAPADSGRLDVISSLNGNAIAQIDLMTITNYVAAKELNWTIDGVPFSYAMTTADANVTGVASSIVAQLNSEPLFSGLYHATSSVGVITLTARIPGIGWTLVATGAHAGDNAITNSVANSAAGSLGFGKLVVPNGAGKCKVASAANLTAKVANCTPAAVNSAVYELGVKVKGQTYLASYTADGSATAKEIVEGIQAALDAQMPAQTVVVTEDDAKVILTAELAGLDFEVVVGTNGATALWTVTTNDGESVDVSRAALGIALRDDSFYSSVENAYPGNSTVSVLKSGRVVVDVEAAITVGNPVYVRLADTGTTGFPLGGFRGSAATDCVKLPESKFRFLKSLGNNQAVLQIG